MLFASCSSDNNVAIDDTETPDDNTTQKVNGLYVLNEGSMGSNKATIDFFDYNENEYRQNLYPEANPNEVKELGDLGNDILIYGSKMYLVINGSNKVEVVDAKTVKKIKSIDLSNGRSLAAANGKVFVSSYDGPIDIDPDTPLGKVYEIDTLSLDISRDVVVGYQPEGMTIINNHLYVANSGGYRVPEYDNTISVVDLTSFEEIDKYEVAINLNKLQNDGKGNLLVSSQGNYDDIPANLYKVDAETGEIVADYQTPISGFDIKDGKLFFFTNIYDANTNDFNKSFGYIDLSTDTVTESGFIDATDDIEAPYGIGINPENGDIFVTDAGNFSSTGLVYQFDSTGEFVEKFKAGIIPGHFAFLQTEE